MNEIGIVQIHEKAIQTQEKPFKDTTLKEDDLV